MLVLVTAYNAGLFVHNGIFLQKVRSKDNLMIVCRMCNLTVTVLIPYCTFLKTTHLPGFHISHLFTTTSAEVLIFTSLALLQKCSSATLGTTETLRRDERPFLQHGDPPIR